MDQVTHYAADIMNAGNRYYTALCGYSGEDRQCRIYWSEVTCPACRKAWLQSYPDHSQA